MSSGVPSGSIADTASTADTASAAGFSAAGSSAFGSSAFGSSASRFLRVGRGGIGVSRCLSVGVRCGLGVRLRLRGAGVFGCLFGCFRLVGRLPLAPSASGVTACGLLAAGLGSAAAAASPACLSRYRRRRRRGGADAAARGCRQPAPPTTRLRPRSPGRSQGGAAMARRLEITVGGCAAGDASSLAARSDSTCANIRAAAGADGLADGSLRSSAAMTCASRPAWAAIGASSLMMADMVVIAPPRCSYGPRPSTAAYSVAPSDHRSDPGVASPPRIRSGAVNPGEPITIPVWVSRGSPSNCAMPKSVSTARSSQPVPVLSVAISTLLGLTSRCSTPARCAAASADSSCWPIRADPQRRAAALRRSAPGRVTAKGPAP